MRCAPRWFLAVPMIALALPATADEVAATVASSLATEAENIRQLAFDGDPDSFFASAAATGDDDHFTLRLDEPVGVRLIVVHSGRPDGSHALVAGTLEGSEDGETFAELARFDEDGTARAEPDGRALVAVRVRPSPDAEHPLVVREIAIDSEPAVARFAYPVEFVTDVSDAPEMQEWIDRVVRECERAYAMINEELKSDGYTPPRLIHMTLRNDYRGVAAAGRGRITGSVRYFQNNPEDIGAMIHETAHIVQQYRGRGNPGWLVEGVADYVRFFKYEPGNIGRLNPDRVRYNASYRTTASFLNHLVENYDAQIVRTINALMREGRFPGEQIIEELTGKPIAELEEEWRESLRR